MFRTLRFCLLLLSLLVSGQLFGRPIDGDPDNRTYRSYAYVYVLDEQGNGVAGRTAYFWAEFIFGGTRSEIGLGSGITNSNGYAYITAEVTVPTWWGSPTYWRLDVTRPTPGECEDIYPNNVVKNGSWYINATFTVDFLEDCDGNGVDDDVEVILAEKFSPVFHKHSWDLQPNLANFDLFIEDYGTSLTIDLFDLNGYPVPTYQVYDEVDPSPLHLRGGFDGIIRYDSFGKYYDGLWRLDIPDGLRHTGAPVGNRPVYYHIYKEGDFVYLQYWIFLYMNDLRYYNQTDWGMWHEGDWEHVTIKLTSNYVPQKVNFYGHYGGYTRNASQCWWSSTNSLTYSGVQQGYDAQHTHLHVWVAANAHALYNRYDQVYRARNSITNAVEYVDNVDYNSSGYNLYFPYNYLDNLGDLITCTNCEVHGITWIFHKSPDVFGKSWLPFQGRVGKYYTTVPMLQMYSPWMPAKRTGWKSFTENEDEFGNTINWWKDSFVNIDLDGSDPPNGD